ncbi:hypothetical protein ACJX0J_028155, partial [Zea mays]
ERDMWQIRNYPWAYLIKPIFVSPYHYVIEHSVMQLTIFMGLLYPFVIHVQILELLQSKIIIANFMSEKCSTKNDGWHKQHNFHPPCGPDIVSVDPAQWNVGLGAEVELLPFPYETTLATGNFAAVEGHAYQEMRSIEQEKEDIMAKLADICIIQCCCTCEDNDNLHWTIMVLVFVGVSFLCCFMLALGYW